VGQFEGGALEEVLGGRGWGVRVDIL
jgi:hypothetical protein